MVTPPATVNNVVVGDGPVVTVATARTLLVQVPPATELLKVVVPPTHIEVIPDIAPGTGLTVTSTVFVQPVEVCVNVIMDVPGATPVTRPPPRVMVATPVDALVHVPATALLNCVVAVGHTVKVPTMAAGAARTVMVLVDVQPPAI